MRIYFHCHPGHVQDPIGFRTSRNDETSHSLYQNFWKKKGLESSHRGRVVGNDDTPGIGVFYLEYLAVDRPVSGDAYRIDQRTAPDTRTHSASDHGPADQSCPRYTQDSLTTLTQAPILNLQRKYFDFDCFYFNLYTSTLIDFLQV